ncbi:MAG: hypothetical protein ABSD38_05450 [Syntrophorhabdales bacterium]|jgi:hypothetical protein
MKQLGVTVSKDQYNREFRIFFTESDVRRACNALVCGDSSEACIKMMEEGRTTCELCYAVLTALRKYPVKIEARSHK